MLGIWCNGLDGAKGAHICAGMPGFGPGFAPECSFELMYTTAAAVMA